MEGSPIRTSPVRRVAFISPDCASLMRNRGDLIAEIIRRRHQVLALVPDRNDPGTDKLEAWANRIGVRLARYAFNETVGLLSSRRPVAALTEHLVEWQPHVAISYGRIAMLHGLQASARARCPHPVAMVTRLDAVLPETGREPSWTTLRGLKSTLAAARSFVFHNQSDRRRLEQLGIMPRGCQVEVVAGAGVDLERFAATPLPPISAGITVSMIAEFSRRTGVIEFCEAARRIKQQSPGTHFVLAGPPGLGRDGVPRAQADSYAEAVEIHGDLDDVRPLLARSHVIVLPSHAEGMPRLLMEALSVGRPVVTSDIAGCRELVDERVNGVLVPPGDAEALATAIRGVLRRPDLMPAMARASRSKAERLYDLRTVNARLLDIFGLA